MCHLHPPGASARFLSPARSLLSDCSANQKSRFVSNGFSDWLSLARSNPRHRKRAQISMKAASQASPTADGEKALVTPANQCLCSPSLQDTLSPVLTIPYIFIFHYLCKWQLCVTIINILQKPINSNAKQYGVQYYAEFEVYLQK